MEHFGWIAKSTRSQTARALARAILAGSSDPLAMRMRCYEAIGSGHAWLVAVTRDIAASAERLVKARDFDRLVEEILQNRHYRNAFDSPTQYRTTAFFAYSPEMQDRPAPLRALVLPRLPTPGDLARWLGVSIQELDWLADCGGWRQRHDVAAFCHYRYLWVPKRNGGSRLLEIPKSRLLKIQRRILVEILDKVPLHGAAHGCVKERSIFTNATRHAGRRLILKMDLSDFFWSVRASRVNAIFRTLGYPPATSRYLASLTTTSTPRQVLRAEPADEWTSVGAQPNPTRTIHEPTTRHLPQGAPTSPGLANLSAYRLDLRIHKAAAESGVRYTRYVDDLFFSTDSLGKARMNRVAAMVYAIVMDEGFEPNIRKTRYMHRSQKQRVAGLTVNAYPNVDGTSYDQLKATLTNCVRHGPAGQNRSSCRDFRAHLLGRISFLERANPVRGAKLRKLFAAIIWDKEKESMG